MREVVERGDEAHERERRILHDGTSEAKAQVLSHRRDGGHEKHGIVDPQQPVERGRGMPSLEYLLVVAEQLIISSAVKLGTRPVRHVR